jgi:hypothetical protein
LILLAALVFAGLIAIAMFGVGMIVALIIKLLLLPLRIISWILKGLFCIT